MLEKTRTEKAKRRAKSLFELGINVDNKIFALLE